MEREGSENKTGEGRKKKDEGKGCSRINPINKKSFQLYDLDFLHDTKIF